MGDAAVLVGQLGRGSSIEGVRVDAERARAHEGAVGFAVGIEAIGEGRPHGAPDVERFGPQPFLIGALHRGAVEALLGDDRAGERHRHLGVVGGLAGQDVPEAPVDELARALGIALDHLGRVGELDEAAEAVACELSEQAALGSGQKAGVGHRLAPTQPRWDRLARALGEQRRIPRPQGQLGRDRRGAAEGAQGAARAVAGVGDLHPALVDEHAPDAAQQRVAGRVVPRAGSEERRHRRALAGGHQGQPVGDARDRAEARGSHAPQVGLGIAVAVGGDEHDVRRPEAGGELGRNRRPVARYRSAAFGPGE